MSAHQSLSSNSRQRTFITADFTSSVDLTAASLKLLEEKCSPRNSSLEINRLQVTSKSATDFASAKRKVSHVTLDPGSSSEVQLQGWAGWLLLAKFVFTICYMLLWLEFCNVSFHFMQLCQHMTAS